MLNQSELNKHSNKGSGPGNKPLSTDLQPVDSVLQIFRSYACSQSFCGEEARSFRSEALRLNGTKLLSEKKTSKDLLRMWQTSPLYLLSGNFL